MPSLPHSPPENVAPCTTYRPTLYGRPPAPEARTRKPGRSPSTQRPDSDDGPANLALRGGRLGRGAVTRSFRVRRSVPSRLSERRVEFETSELGVDARRPWVGVTHELLNLERRHTSASHLGTEVMAEGVSERVPWGSDSGLVGDRPEQMVQGVAVERQPRST